MKAYKKIIRDALAERKFEITELFDETEIPWWIEEHWTITRSHDQLQLLVLFLTDRGWENGTKLVSEVTITEKMMANYTDSSPKIVSLLLDKGRFDEKIKLFCAALDAYLSLATSKLT